MKTPEGHEKDEIRDYLRHIGAWHFVTFMSGYGSSGQPDIVCCLAGLFVGIEVKREGKEPTVLQRRRMLEIENAGGKCFWGTGTKVIGEIDAWLQRSVNAVAQ